LRLILEAHPDVVCYDELKGYSILQNPIVENPLQARWIGFKLPRWTEQLTRPILFDEGAEGYCKNFYRGEKILFLYRDVRDTIASMLKLKTGRSNWCETWVPRIINSKVQKEPEFRERYAAQLSVIDNCASPLIGMAALYWRYKTDALLDYSESGLPVLAVSYEDLVTDPRPVLQSVCRHLGIPFHENLLRHNELPHTELFENGLTVGHNDPRQPIQSGSVRQWDRFLSKEDLLLIGRIAAPAKDPAPSCLPEVGILRQSASLSL
jgi:hypothetical protein